MNRAMLLSAVVVALALPGQAQATGTGLRTITNIGCHLNNNTCWVDISGSAVGPANCRATSIRFNITAPNGKNIFSLMTAAFLAGKQVSFELPDTCYVDQPIYPTLTYMNFI
ncbi:hypothetical protein ACN28E_05565 [Archangium lansingense]|uniref:hypothetical protein n=1 Tax=Archangium lansingense TaxID=2995310 RepID=UPI003B7B77D9